MELINQTRYPTLLFRSVMADDMIAASVGVRVTFDLNSGQAVPAATQEWEMHNQPWMSEYGPMDSDDIFRRGGVDIMLLGKAHAPHGIPTTQMDVRVRLENKLLHTITVFGNRVWEKNMFGVVSSKPEPFTELPLTLFNAYGGVGEWDGLKFPYSNNPHGKGFYWEKEHAVGNPLPNLEDPKNLIEKWDHRPDPVGVASCPLSELRLRDCIKFDENGQVTEMSPRFYNSAFRNLIVPELLPGQRILVEGVLPSGPFLFTMPRFSLQLRLQFGETTHDRQLYVDQVALLPDLQQALITYRFHFQYKIRPMEKRVLQLSEIVQN